jgi:serine/threonine protein kinase
MSATVPTENQDALPAGSRLGEFEIHKVVGVGGFGIVYRAYDHALQRIVALKEYLPGALAGRGENRQVSIRSTAHAETFGVGLRSFVNEARLLAQFDHPALLKVYRFWEDNGTAYMVMPFYDGVTLHHTRRGMSRPPAQAWMRAMLDPVLGALEVMHREHVYHRDVAPDNIILRPEAGPVLLDLGAARKVIGDRTQMLTAIVKPNYAPLEQYSETSQLKQGPWTDLYALGAVVYFCATGKPPLPASTRTLHDELMPLPQLVRQGELPWTEAFAQVWQSVLALRPSERPQSVAALRALLDGAAAALPPPGPANDDHLPTVLAGSDAPTVVTRPSGPASASRPGGPATAPPAGRPMPTIPTTVPMRRAKTRRFRSRGQGTATAPGALHEEPGRRSGGMSRVLAWVLLVAAPVAFAGVLYWSTLARPGPAQDPGLQAGLPASAAAGAASGAAGATPAAGGAASAAPAAGTLAGGAQAGQPPASEPAGAGAAGATGTGGLPGQMPALDSTSNPPSGMAGAPGAPEGPAPVPSSAALVVEPGQAVAASQSAGSARRPPAQAVRLPPRAANDGALLPGNPSGRVPPAGDAAPASATLPAATSVVDAAQPPRPAAAPAKPASPRQTCGSRVFVALYRCMQRQCERPDLTQHPECVEWRRLEEGNRGRR